MKPKPKPSSREPFFTDEVDVLHTYKDSPETDPAVWEKIQKEIWKRRGRKQPTAAKKRGRG